MADQQNPQSPNAGRISAMLQDLSAQRGDQPADSPAVPARPVAQPTVGGPPPVNLPIGQAPATPVRVPPPLVPTTPPAAAQPAPRPIPPTPPVVVAPIAPVAPKPPIAVPPASFQPAGAIPPPRPAPPPAPREVASTVPPRPATPPAPPPPPAAAPTPVAPPASGPQYASELRTMSTDIGSMQVGQPPAAVRPAAVPLLPATPQAPAPAPQIAVAPTMAIPPVSSGGGSKKMMFLILGLLVLAIGAFAVWSMLSGGGTQVAEETPTPSAAPTLTPRERALSSYFGLPKATATITGTDTAVTDFRNALLTAQPAAKQVVSMDVLRSSSPLTPSAFLAITFSQVPADVSGSLGTDWVALAYGQTEAFDGSGQPLADAATEPSLALVIEVTDASKANQAMQAWEGVDLDTAAEKLFGYIQENAIVDGFNSGTYREVPIRYRNFPYADKSLDWGLALGSNGKNYLILTSSRESAFFVIDQLMQ